jgi:acid phosphatase family membrane protein YuiD
MGGQVLWVSIFACFLAQVLKVIVVLVKDRKMNFRYLVTSGGMPSSHSSLVVCLAASTGLVDGWGSTTFAISVVLAMVVMYDAAGVRQAAGKQARVLNKIMDDWEQTQSYVVSEDRLKELLGHTPRQVLMGALLGVVVAGWYFG